MWVNGMLHEGNPLAHGQLDDMSDDLEIYGVDSGGPSLFEDSDNNVIIPPVSLPLDVQSVQSYVQERIDPLVSSTEMGIDIFVMIRQIVEEKIENFLQHNPDASMCQSWARGWRGGGGCWWVQLRRLRQLQGMSANSVV